MKKRVKKKTKSIITKKEHDAWHKKHGEYDTKDKKEHAACHKKYGIVVKK